MNNVALITGASSGIGRDLARLHAQRGGDLVVVARRFEALNELKEELENAHGVSVFCIASDLSERDAPQRIYDELKQKEIDVDVLINNAGFGKHGKYHEQPWAQVAAIIQVNVLALCELTHLFLPDMVARKRGKILNVASTAAFVPGPLFATYYATKAFVVSFSQAVAEEVRDSNVTVTVLCPGAVDTEFIARANLEGIRALENAAPSMDVAKVGYRAMLAGKLIAINDWKLTLILTWILPLFPRRTVLRLTRQAMEKG